ncbi:MAG: hypothetical protein C0392_05355 [Syntrophus sp. (in: bacteria)]|nr:hypothetical protein [Syntrophus sp. (in: bacteria)]
MRIKKRLQLNTFIILVMVLFMVVSLIWSFREAFRMDENEALVAKMQRVAFERVILRSEYQLYLSKHAKAQWYEKTRYLKGLLEQARTILTDGENRALLQDIQKNFDGTVAVFSRIMEISEKGRNPDKDDSPYREREKRLVSQLLLKTHTLSNGISRLQESAHRASISAYKRSIFLFIVFIGCAIIVTIGNSVVIQRLLTRRIVELRKGTKIIGAGNLDHTIRITGIDELSDLAEAANEMAARLKKSYTSVANLQREIAERKEAEGALRQSEERYRTTLMSIGDGVIVTDTAGLVQALNPVAESLTGWTDEDVFGMPVTKIFPIINEETGQSIENPVQLVMESGLIVGLANHTVLIAKDGTKRPIADSGAPICDEEGEISGVVLVFRDQTEERATQKRLRQEMERAQQYLDAVGVMMVALDNQAKVTLINPKGCEVLGYTEQEIIGKNWFDYFLTEYDFHHVKDVFARIVAGQSKADEYVENHVLTGSGEKRLIAWHNTVLRDDDGKIIGTLSSGEDITARRCAEEAVRSSLQEKEVLIREIHHRVKNNLQIICSLLMLEADPTRENDTDKVLMKISNRVRAMSLVHEKLYQSSDMAHISMREYIHDLAGRIISAYEVQPDRIRFHVDVEDIPLSIDSAIPFGLILNELITNAIKHAFPEEMFNVQGSKFKVREPAQITITLTEEQDADTPPSVIASTPPSVVASTPPSVITDTPPSVVTDTPPSVIARSNATKQSMSTKQDCHAPPGSLAMTGSDEGSLAMTESSKGSLAMTGSDEGSLAMTGSDEGSLPQDSEPRTLNVEHRTLAKQATLAKQVVLTVSDNGIGLPPAMDIHTINTLGLRLVRILGEGQLKGTVFIDRTGGTTFHITIPGGFHG